MKFLPKTSSFHLTSELIKVQRKRKKLLQIKEVIDFFAYLCRNNIANEGQKADNLSFFV